MSAAAYTATIKLWRLVDGDVLHNLDALPPGRELFQRGAMELQRRDDTPVCVDHVKDRRIGVVRELSEFADVDGLWLCARVRIDRPPAWLRKGSSASISYASAGSCSLGPDHERITRGLVTEVSLLSPGVRPEEPRARVVLLERVEAPAAETTRAPGDVLLPAGAMLRRPNVGAVLGVR